ncbi:MAG: hypothetical protein HYW02_00775 [Deltaproteobacteria bacterium]|nr:hypothetical protein [Deltaproteobacteria bacterium]MBI2500016.1 hypothetical protein [Deltaproteobacteria bacterium]
MKFKLILILMTLVLVALVYDQLRQYPEEGVQRYLPVKTRPLEERRGERKRAVAEKGQEISGTQEGKLEKRGVPISRVYASPDQRNLRFQKKMDQLRERLARKDLKEILRSYQKRRG